MNSVESYIRELLDIHHSGQKALLALLEIFPCSIDSYNLQYKPK
jgi:hypothetical protein